MALFRRLFYRKPPDRLLEISERVYVFDCCFSSEILGDKAFKNYLGNIVSQFQDYFPDASFMVCNFREGDKKSLISDILSEYDMPVMDYPWQYEGCPLLPLEMIHHFLKSSESWLSLEGQHNVLLMHCERGGWPVLAFMLSGLLLYRKQYSGEQKTLEMVYKQAPKELLHLFCSLNPQPSHLRYLHYITRQSSESDWPPKDKPFTLECIILRVVPQFDVKGGFRPVVRVHGQDPLTTTNRCPKILISTPISKKVARSYRQESAGLKINARCHVQGDVVLECIHVDEDLEQEVMMFRIMFNTAFVESDILVLNSEDIDVAWNVKDQFPRDFRAEVLLSEFVEAESEMNLEAETGDGDADFDDLEGASIEEFFEAEEIFSNSEVYIDTQILRTKNAMVDIALNSEIHVINDNEEDKLESGVVQQSYNNFTIKRSEPTPIANEAECIFTAIDSELDVTEKLIMLDGVFPQAERTNLESSLLRKTEAFSSIVEESPVSRSFEDSIPKALNTSVISNIFQKMVTIDGEPNKFYISSPANGRNSKTEYNASLEHLGDSDNTTSIFVSSVTNHATAQEMSFYCGRDHDLTRCDIAGQREPELVTNDWHNDIEKKVEVYSDLSLETSLATEHRLRDSSITVCDKRIITEKLIALNEVSGVEEDKLAKNDNFFAQDREDVVPELKEQRSTAGPAHSECAAKAVLSQHENGFKNAIEGKLDTHVSFVEEKCLLESANSKNNHETNYKFKDSILGDKSQTIYSSETSIKRLLIAETVDSARENDDSASEVRAEAKFTNKKTGGIRRRQNNEKNLSPILKKSTTRIRPPSNPAIEKQKGSQQEASYLHTSTSKVIIVPRWISPNKASDSPYLYKPSYPPFRYNSAPSALPNSSIQTDDQIISAIDLPVDCVSLDGGTTLLGSMPPPPPPPPPSFRQPISSRTSIKVTSSLPPPPSQPCPFPPPSSLTFLGSAIKFSCPPLSPPVPPPHPPTNLSASISASNVPLPSSPKLQISQPVLKKASVPHSQALSTSSMRNSSCTSPHLPPPPPPPPPLPYPPNTTRNFLVASPSPPVLPSSFEGISNSIPFSISSPFKPSCSPIPHFSIANVGGLITDTPPLKVSSNGSLEEPPSSLSSPSLVPKLGVIPLPLLLEPHVETPSAPPPPPRCVPLPPRLPLSGCNITPPTAPLGGNQGAPIPPAIFGGRNSTIPASLHGWHGAPPTPPRAPGAPPPPRAPGAPPLPPFGSSNTSNGSRSLLTTALVGGRGRGILRPMVSGSTSLAPRRSPLKPLHWVKVTRAVQGSLWADIQKSDDAPSVFEFDELELESLFSAVIPKLDDSSKSEGRRKSLGSKSDKVHLIELRRANNTEIMLTKIKIPLSDLMSAALSLDDSVLEADQVENLIKFCPTKEEMELLKGFTGDKEKLGKCEQFFLELMKVPRVESKLRVFSFKIQFFQQVSDLKKNLNIINSACEQIRSSVKFKEIMKKILYLGNMLNQGTARGSAIGFRLDSLLKLTDTRATNSKMTLMHYLCKVLASRSPHLLNFHDGLTSLEAASKIQLKSLAEEMQAIIKGLEKVELELNASESDGPVTKNFQRTLKEFIALAGADVQSLSSFYSAVGRNADALALYFGEDPARCPFEQVISTLMNFVVMFRRAHQENHKHAELEKKKALKDAEAEKSHKASNISNKNDMSLGDQLQQSLDKAKAANQQGKVVG